MAKLTKKQLALVDAMKNGGWIWTSGTTGFYLAKRDESDRVHSTAIHAKTFTSLLEAGVIKPSDNKGEYTLA